MQPSSVQHYPSPLQNPPTSQGIARQHFIQNQHQQMFMGHPQPHNMIDGSNHSYSNTMQHPMQCPGIPPSSNANNMLIGGSSYSQLPPNQVMPNMQQQHNMVAQMVAHQQSLVSPVNSIEQQKPKRKRMSKKQQKEEKEHQARLEKEQQQQQQQQIMVTPQMSQPMEFYMMQSQRNQQHPSQAIHHMNPMGPGPGQPMHPRMHV